MIKLTFSPEAKKDLTDIGDYIAFKLANKAAARKLIANIKKAIQPLQKFPESGTPLVYPGTHILYRYLVCENYMIFYRYSSEAVSIDRILYSRRDYFPLLFGDASDEEQQAQCT